MRLTPAQQATVDHGSRRAVVLGAAGAGKTTVLAERYRRLVRTCPPSRVLVVSRNGASAQRFLSAVLPGLSGGFDALPITTVWGLAHDVVARAGGAAVELLTAAEQRALVRRLLATEDPSQWPRLGHLLARPAFAGEVVRGLTAAREVGLDVAEGKGGRWAELARFAPRYYAALDEARQVDGLGLIERAAAAARPGRFDHALVDDADALSGVGMTLLAAVGGSLTTTSESEMDGDVDATFRLTTSFRTGPVGTLLRCDHASAEAEAVAGELLEAHAQGVLWSGMAVLVRQMGRRARSIVRALARHGIPVVANPALARDEPVVAGVVDALRWVAGDERALNRLLVSPLARLRADQVREVRRAAVAGEPIDAQPAVAGLVELRDRLRARVAAGDSPADLAYEAWAARLTHVDDPGLGLGLGLGAVDDRALDALVALIDGLGRYSARHPAARLADALAAVDEGVLTPEPWRPAASSGDEGVAVISIRASAGREWHTVVVAGLVEGELPRARVRAPLLGDPPIDEERRLFAIATSRAKGSLVAVAAPAPGVLLSRFVESWPPGELKLPMAPGRLLPPRLPTAGTVPVWPDGELHLSASQLDTYDDCPLRYAYQYVARAREESGIHAALGTLVHEALATFLDPEVADPPPRTLEGLMAVADSVWTDEIGRYRPQIEEARRDFVTMLTNWWTEDGVNHPRPLAVERAFDVEVGRHRLMGRIDRVDRADDGAGLRVLDYKTGKKEPRPGDVADDLQLAVYHLAATRDPELAALGPPTQLQLQFLRTMRRLDQPVTDDHVERTESRVLAVAERMLAEDFTPAVDANCRNCSYHRLCPLQPEGRQT